MTHYGHQYELGWVKCLWCQTKRPVSEMNTAQVDGKSVSACKDETWCKTQRVPRTTTKTTQKTARLK